MHGLMLFLLHQKRFWTQHGKGISLDESHTLQQPLSLTLDKASGKLRAQFDPQGSLVAPDLPLLRQSLQDQGFAEFHLDEKALIGFIDACREAKELVLSDIGERRDASFALELSKDLMSAWLTLHPAQGGKPIGSTVNAALREQGVVHGILHKDLDAALAAGFCDHLLIAKGEPEQQGIPGRFDALFLLKDKSATVDELAVIKFRDLGHILLVHPGDQLMLRTPPVQGKNGIDIKGQVVLAKAIPDMPFAADLQGAKTDPGDPNLLLATNAGQPMTVKDGVIVNPVIEVPDVDLSTGNITFEGTIHIAGDIKAGMSLNVTGDVIVKGMVEAAQIIAGGNVVVKGGIIGRAEKKQGSQTLAESTARIRCGGSVQASFMENVHVEAGNAIQIDQNARQCELIARNEIMVGKSGSKTGQIIGGRTQAGMLIEAGILGSASAIKTRLQVGVDPYLEQQILTLREQIQRKIAELDQVLKLLIFFTHNPQKNIGGVGEKVEAKRLHQLAEIDALSAEVAALEDQLKLVDQASIKVGKAIHDGVEIQIGRQIWQVVEDTGGGTYKLQESQIVIV